VALIRNDLALASTSKTYGLGLEDPWPWPWRPRTHPCQYTLELRILHFNQFVK